MDVYFLQLTKKRSKFLLFSPVLNSRYRSVFHAGEERAWCRVQMPWYAGIWVGYAAASPQALFSGCFPRKTTVFGGLGFWLVSPKVYLGLCLQSECQDRTSRCLEDDFLDSGAVGEGSESYWLRSFSRAVVVCMQRIEWEKRVTLVANWCGGNFSPCCTSWLAQEMLLDVGFGEVVWGSLQLLAGSCPAGHLLAAGGFSAALCNRTCGRDQNRPVACFSPTDSSTCCSRSNQIH